MFIDVLMPAVSELASEDWGFRFAALLTLQDQNVMGRGAVGFDLAEFDWGAERERARSKEFVLRATALAASGHRWSDWATTRPACMTTCTASRPWWSPAPPPADSSAARGFPSPDEAAMAPCVRHRVLSALPLRDGCLLCNRPHYQPARFHIRRALPADFPPFQTVFRFFSRWRAAGIFNLIRDQLRRLVRRAMGALPHPVAAVIDSRSVKVAATVPRSTSGYDAGKKLPGRKRDIVVGMEGLLQALPTARSGVVRAVPCRRSRPRSTEGRVTRADQDP
ncbi:hypothetical protein [Streptomyces europaeiscabiei]|uniref:hypothetical protein n=1 Tax=Streptomyces europaeiscabiei TaxID=146819 RepID=UPI0029BD4692|nr:hypothetical protein [Streptomyces europaeiscabiei]MDX2758724.1 hypothetical protein [Streptomyces europaeiscabiei]